MASKHPTYRAFCYTCYTNTLHEGTKRDCERACTGHMEAFKHKTGLMQIADRTVVKQIKPTSAHKEN